MDNVESRLDRERLGGCGPFRVINLFVNGTRLQDLVRSVERPMRKPKAIAGLAGNYAGLAIGPTLPALAEAGLRVTVVSFAPRPYRRRTSAIDVVRSGGSAATGEGQGFPSPSGDYR